MYILYSRTLLSKIVANVPVLLVFEILTNSKHVLSRVLEITSENQAIYMWQNICQSVYLLFEFVWCDCSYSFGW